MVKEYENFKSLKRYSTIKNELDKLIESILAHLHSKVDKEIDFPVDIYIEDNTLVIEVEMPGLEKEELLLENIEKFIELTGEKDTVKRKYKSCVALERTNGKFKKIVYLEKTVNIQKAESFLDEGVLTMKIPLVNEKRGKKIIKIN